MPDIQKLNVKGTDFDIDDPNDVATDGGELLDTVINYESATTPTIGSFTAFLNQFVSGTKVGQWFKNFRAGCDFILHIGSIVNNCVTDNEALPLSAAQGKMLMDELTEVKSDLTELDDSISALQLNAFSSGLQNVSLDTLTSNGLYRISDGCPDIPDGSTGGYLLVFNAVPTNSNPVTLQLWIRYNSQVVMIRSNWYGSWYSWQQIL